MHASFLSNSKTVFFNLKNKIEDTIALTFCHHYTKTVIK